MEQSWWETVSCSVVPLVPLGGFRGSFTPSCMLKDASRDGVKRTELGF